MNSKEAKQTIRVAQHSNALLNQQLLHLQETMDPQEFERLTVSFGRVMGELFVEILDPLYKSFPELAPKEFGGSASAVENSEFKEIFDLIESRLDLK